MFVYTSKPFFKTAFSKRRLQHESKTKTLQKKNPFLKSVEIAQKFQKGGIHITNQPNYPLVIQRVYGKWPIYRWFAYSKWWCSIARLNYQMVVVVVVCGLFLILSLSSLLSMLSLLSFSALWSLSSLLSLPALLYHDYHYYRHHHYQHHISIIIFYHYHHQLWCSSLSWLSRICSPWSLQ